MAEIRSALGDGGPIRRGGAQHPGLETTEIVGRELIQVAGWPDSFDRIALEVAGLVACTAPVDWRIAVTQGEVTMFRVGPERLWIAAPRLPDLTTRLAQAFTTDDAVIAALGHSRTVLRLAGPGAAGLLGRCVAIDLDVDAFPVGAFAQTPLRQVGVLLHRVAGAAFDLYIPRSYALSLGDWLKTA
jgi:sarcosine oxidase subunit gamma